MKATTELLWCHKRGPKQVLEELHEDLPLWQQQLEQIVMVVMTHACSCDCAALTKEQVVFDVHFRLLCRPRREHTYICAHFGGVKTDGL